MDTRLQMQDRLPNPPGGAVKGSKILVGLGQHDQVEEVLPYLERVAEPTMKVVCLVRYPVEARNYLRDHWVTTDWTRAARLAGRRLMARYSWDAQKRLAEEKIVPVFQAMHKKAVNVEVDLYTGLLRTAVLDRSADGDVRWIIIPSRSIRWSSQLLERTVTPFARFKWALFCCGT